MAVTAAPSTSPDRRAGRAPASSLRGGDAARLWHAQAMQRLLTELLETELLCRQLRWNVRGPNAALVQIAADELGLQARGWAHLAADRIAALGLFVDHHSGAAATADSMPLGAISTERAVATLLARLTAVSEGALRARERVPHTDAAVPELLDAMLASMAGQQGAIRSLAERVGISGAPAAAPCSPPGRSGRATTVW